MFFGRAGFDLEDGDSSSNPAITLVMFALGRANATHLSTNDNNGAMIKTVGDLALVHASVMVVFLDDEFLVVAHACSFGCGRRGHVE